MEKAAHSYIYDPLKSIDIELPHQVPLDYFLLQKLYMVARIFVCPHCKNCPCRTSVRIVSRGQKVHTLFQVILTEDKF